MNAMAIDLAAMAPMSSEAKFCGGKISADCARMGFVCVMVASMRTALPVIVAKFLAKGLNRWRAYGTYSFVCGIAIPAALFYAMNILHDEVLEARHFLTEGAASHGTGARVFSPILYVFYVLCMSLLIYELARLYAELLRINVLRRPLIFRHVITSAIRLGSTIAILFILQNSFINVSRFRACAVVGCAIGYAHGEFGYEFIQRMYNMHANRVHRVAATSSELPLHL